MSRIADIITRVRDTLADKNGDRWSDDLLLRLIDEAQKDICRRAKLLRKKVDIPFYTKEVTENKISYINLPDDLLWLDKVVYQGNIIPFYSHSYINSKNPLWETEESTVDDLRAVIIDKRNRKQLRLYPTIITPLQDEFIEFIGGEYYNFELSDNDLTAKYDFENNVNDSFGNYNGEWIGTPQYDIGIEGLAAKLEFDNQIKISNLNIQDEFTLSMWLNISQSTYGNTILALSETEDINILLGNPVFNIIEDKKSLLIRHWDYDSSHGEISVEIPDYNTWFKLIISINNNQIKVFLDDKLVGISGYNNIFFNYKYLYIGGNVGYYLPNTSNCKIDTFKIFNKFLEPKISLQNDIYYGISTEIDGLTGTSLYGIPTTIIDDEELDIQSNYGIIVDYKVIDEEKYLTIYYLKKPNTISSVDDSLEIDESFDTAIKNYVIGMALRNDLDLQNRQAGNEWLQLYERDLQEAIKDDFRDFIRTTSRNKYEIQYKGFI